jgi:hypothetical protein
MHEERRLAYSGKVSPRYRVQIEMQIVRLIDVVAAGIPLIQVYSAQVYNPEQRRQILNDWEVDYIVRRMAD